MKLRTRGFSMILIGIIILNFISKVYASEVKELTLTKDITDAIGDIEYGETASEYIFDVDVLSGVEDGDEVYLVANAVYTSTLAGESTITLTDFRLAGADSDSYKVPDIEETIKKEINIDKKVIKISPQKPYIYYGQVVPESISDIADYTEYLVLGDNVNIEAEFKIEAAEENEYSIVIDETSITCSNDNYTVELDKSVKFEVKEFVPNVECKTETDDYSGKNTAELKAPTGYLISEKIEGNFQWSESIVIDLEETQNGSTSYYLRCNNSDSEYYQAISNEMIYEYTSFQTLPEIKSIKVKKVDINTVLNFLTFGVFGNGGVRVTVEAAGSTIEQETTIYLGEDGTYESATATPMLGEDGKYYYIAEFNYDVYMNANLSAYAVNSSGAGAKYTKLTEINDNEAVDDGKIVLENTEPKVVSGKIESDIDGVSCEIEINDVDSGIAKVEYGWDLDRTLCNEAINSLSGHYQGFSDNEYTDKYLEYNYDFASKRIDDVNIFLELSFLDSVWVNSNKHALYIRVTDNAGNVYSDVIKDDIGSDMYAPNITGVEIRSNETNITGTDIRLLELGTFSNEAVEIVITAEDNETLGDYFFSDIKEVTVNGKKTEKNESGEYVLPISNNEILNYIEITVSDNIGRTTTETIMAADKTGVIKSNDLIIEDSAPKISWNYSVDAYEDSTGKLWYGLEQNDEKLEIVLDDNNGDVKSGLYSVKITDNDKTLCEKKDFISMNLKYTETILIKNLEDGVHSICVIVEDNSGNTATETYTFYIDRTLPESSGIKLLNTDYVLVDEAKWFDKDEIIEFRVDSADLGSGLKSIVLKVNEQNFYFENDEILTDENGKYVVMDTKDIVTDTEHKYTITGIVKDFANNTLELNQCVIYKDFESPSVAKITIKNNILDKIVNVLSFGVYSNDSIILKAYVSDGQFDSGIDYVTINYNGLAEAKAMKNEGNGVFSVTISPNEKLYESSFEITVYDKMGNSCTAWPNIENAVNGLVSNHNQVMIETIEPELSLNLPASDGVTSVNGERWYRSNKSIEINTKDVNSGIRNIDFTVNEVAILYDKNGNKLLKADDTAAADINNTNEQVYVFDTNYLISQAGDAADGKYQIDIKIMDNAGNIKSHSVTYYIDTTAPQIYKIDFSTATADGKNDTKEFIEELEYGFYFKENFTMNVYVLDESASSGLREVNYRLVPYENGIKQPDITGTQVIQSGIAKITVPKGFKGQIYIEAVDNVDNHSIEKTTRGYIIDNNAPNINVIQNRATTYSDADGNSLYVDDNIIIVEVTDFVSGIKEIAYSQSSEKNKYLGKIVSINNRFYKIGDSLGDGWIVAEVDRNIVTKVIKTFDYSEDDNNIILTVSATDNSANKSKNINSEKFTIDKTNPLINITFHEDNDDDIYYEEKRVAEITVIERNFDPELIKTIIKNSFGEIPEYSFTKKSVDEYVAIIDFDEGDYTFDVSGSDLGNHQAIVNFSGGNERKFSVDKTIPEIVDNFEVFKNSSENSFNSDKTVNLKVVEHNFSPELIQLHVYKKGAGVSHTVDGLKEVTSEVLENIQWNSRGDIHTISFILSEDGVYQVDIISTDLAGNTTAKRSTGIFEIDKTTPIVKNKNGVAVSADNTQSIEIYTYERRNDSLPEIEFEDLNIDFIKYSLTLYVLDNTFSENASVMKPVKLYLEEDTDKTGVIKGNKFVLSEFDKDGVYVLELTAVDVAGNESLLNINTYTKMIEQDVLACIMESNVEQKTGLYSLQYENGEAISKRPDEFADINISVWAKNDTDVYIILRDTNGNEINTDAQSAIDNSIYGMQMYNFTINAEFFKNNFQNDTDAQMYLSVKNGDNRIDLGKIHIDNIAPTCDIPDEFKSWKWYLGEEKRTITISNISEFVDESECKIYDNGKEIEFEYSSENNTIIFTLEKGWHNVGISLSDMAGNTYNIQEKTNIHIGFFWLWIIVGVSSVVTAITAYAIILNIRKRQAEESR